MDEIRRELQRRRLQCDDLQHKYQQSLEALQTQAKLIVPMTATIENITQKQKIQQEALDRLMLATQSFPAIARLEETVNHIRTILEAEKKSKESLHSPGDQSENPTEFQWTVDSFKEQQALERSKRFNCANWTRSPAFYSHPSGYKLRLDVSLFGKGRQQGKYMFLAVLLLRGEFDNSLTWPFRKTMSVSLQSSSGTIRREMKVTIAPDWNIVTKRPTRIRPRAAENPPLFTDSKFISLDELDRYYLKDGRLTFKVEFVQREDGSAACKSDVGDFWERIPGGLLRIQLTNGNYMLRWHENLVNKKRTDPVVCYVHPVTLTPLRNYFEVRILHLPEIPDNPISAVAVGLCGPASNAKDALPGWCTNTIGFHSDDGGLFKEQTTRVDQFGEICGHLDVIGCGIFFEKDQACRKEDLRVNNAAAKKVFFTRNGLRIGSFCLVSYPDDNLLPSIGFANVGVEVELTPPFLRHYEDFQETNPLSQNNN